jgi:hypothetical protein
MLDGKALTEKILVGVISAVALGVLAVLWNWTSGGGLIRALGGLTSASPVQAGTIVAFFSPEQKIPDGWVVCDGSNGTPDLRNKFIQGVTSFADVGLDENAKASHKHSGTTSAALGPTVQSTTQGNDDLNTTYASHQHSFTTDEVSNLPPNFRLVYIMKVK